MIEGIDDLDLKSTEFRNSAHGNAQLCSGAFAKEFQKKIPHGIFYVQAHCKNIIYLSVTVEVLNPCMKSKSLTTKEVQTRRMCGCSASYPSGL